MSRYSKIFPQCKDVPGQKIGYKQLPTPKNCKQLIYGKKVETYSEYNTVTPSCTKGFTYYPWQVRAINRAVTENTEGIYLNHPTGSGKTITAASIALLWRQPQQKILWITKSPVKLQVRRELGRRFDIAMQILDTETVYEIDTTADVVIINYDILVAWRSVLVDYIRNGILVIDEAHTVKSHLRETKVINPVTGKPERVDANNIVAAQTALSRAASKVIAMSATPMPNSTSDLWAQLDYVENDCWGTNWDFIHHYCAAYKGTYGLVTSGQSNVDELKMRLDVIMDTVEKSEIAAVLPPMSYELIVLSPEEQCRPVAGMPAEMKAAAMQGPGALREMRFVEASSRKRKWVSDFVLDQASNGMKCVLMTGRRADVHSLVKTFEPLLSKLGIPVWGVTGEDSVKYRDDVVLAYMAAKKGVLIGTDCLGTGTDLQDTDVALMLMLTDTPGKFIQWAGRFPRPGQTRPCRFIIVSAANTIDDEVDEILVNKLTSLDNLFTDEHVRQVTDVLTQVNEEGLLESILAKV